MQRQYWKLFWGLTQPHQLTTLGATRTCQGVLIASLHPQLQRDTQHTLDNTTWPTYPGETTWRVKQCMWRCNNKTISLETNQYRKLAVYPYSSQHLSNVCISALTYWHHHQVMLWSNEEHASVRLLFKQRIDKIFTFQISADWDKEYNTCSVGPWCLVQQCAVSAGEASTHPLTCQGRGQVDGCSVTNTLLCSADAATAVYTLPNVMFPFIHLVIV